MNNSLITFPNSECIFTFLGKILNSPYIQGQLISLCLACNGIFASFLSKDNANFPLLILFVFYGSLSTIFFRKIYSSNAFIFSQPWYMYLLAAIIDVEGNFVMILAYNYTSMTSVSLLDCFGIPCVVYLSYTLLGARYQVAHYVGAAIAITGMVCTMLSDTVVKSRESGAYPNAIWGDTMALLGAALYACSNVLQEKLVKGGDNFEFLGLLGVNGAVITLIQGLCLDLQPFLAHQWGWQSVLYVLGFSTLLVLMYTRTSVFLQENDSVVFNLSIQTSDVYSVLLSYLVFGNVVNWLYGLSFALSAIGLSIYYSAPSPVAARTKARPDGTQSSEVDGNIRIVMSPLQSRKGPSSRSREEDMEYALCDDFINNAELQESMRSVSLSISGLYDNLPMNEVGTPKSSPRHRKGGHEKSIKVNV